MNFIENESEQKLRGGYYTSEPIARFLARWVLEGRADRVLEPSCGDGVFITALDHVGLRPPKAITACELDATEARKARSRGRTRAAHELRIFPTDFLSWALPLLEQEPAFDGVVGNPPFIRYQYLDELLQAHSEKIFARFDLPFTKHTNAWVPFVMASIALLRPGGRLAMVVPAELLHVLHAQSLRRFLIERCARVLVIDPEELMFGGTLQGVVLLLAERSSTDLARDGSVAVMPVRTSAFLSESPSALMERADFVPGAALGPKWMLGLLSPAERRLLVSVAERAGVRRFRDVADVDVGIVTGANKFFLVSDAVVRDFDLQRWAHPMFGRSNHVQGAIYDNRNHEDNRTLDLPTNFLWFPEDPSLLNDGARRYLVEGERLGLHKRYKCRIRKPWYRVPSVYAAPIGMLKRSHNFPRLVLNRANALTTDTAYRIQTREVAPATFVACFVNSLTALTCELEGRHYGGGVLELVPSEIERVLVPLPKRIGEDALARLDASIRAEAPAEHVLSAQDRNVLTPLGLTKADREALLAAWCRIRNRRHRTQGDDAGSVEEEINQADAPAFKQPRSQKVRAVRAEGRKAEASGR